MRTAILEDPISRAAVWSGRVAWFSVLVAAFAIILVRTDRIDSVQALSVLIAAFAVAVLAILIAAYGLAVIWREGFGGSGRAFSALALSGALLAAPVYMALKAATLPAINDISTDLGDPPSFSRSRASLAARGDVLRGQSSLETRAKQRAGYGGIAPLTIERAPEEAFALARAAAQSMGWRIIEANPPGARTGVASIDAIDLSLLLKFPDDIAVRIRPLANGSRIDVRSASRHGWHDFGANARRVQRYLQELNALNEAK